MCSAEQWLTRQRPALRELVSQALGRVTTPQPPVRIPRHERDARRLGSRQCIGDDLRSPGGKTAQASFLPGSDDSRDRIAVLHCRASECEREPPPGALGTPPDRPGGRRPTAFTERRLDSPQSGGAVLADLFAGPGTNEAALRQQQVEHERTR